MTYLKKLDENWDKKDILAFLVLDSYPKSLFYLL